MASLSSTYASKHRQIQWPSPWLWPPNSHSEASRRFLLPFSSPSTRPAFFCRDSNPQICCCSSSGFSFHRRRSFLGFLSHRNRRIHCFCAGISDPTPSPPSPSDPPPRQGESIAGALSTVQDTVRMFFAVFFWMALFFWASAWDGRNGGKRNKGNRFKR